MAEQNQVEPFFAVKIPKKMLAGILGYYLKE